MRSFLLLFLVTAIAQAQSPIVSFGVKGGIPLTEATVPRFVSLFPGTGLIYADTGAGLSTVTTGRWTVGPTVELHLPWNFSVEFDALYRTFRSGSLNTSRSQPGLPVTIQTFHQDAKAWDLPLLLKYRFPVEKIRPFILGGKSWMHESRRISFSSVCTAAESCTPPDSAPAFLSSTSSNQTQVRDGWVAGGGVEFKYRRLSFSPELRYTRMLQPRTNQVTLLFGITF